MISETEVKENAKTYAEQVFKILRKDKTNAMNFINNYYFSKIPDFVKEIEPVIDE